MANITTVTESLVAHVQNFSLTELIDTISRIIPNGVESITHGISTYALINMAKYNSFASSLEEGDSLPLQLIGLIGYKLFKSRSLFYMYLHMILAALFPIVAGSFSSLGRPSSAAKPSKKASKDGEIEDEFDVELPETAMETLGKADAIMFPIIAGIMLSGLYFLIKWLDDPAILNQFMGWYFSLVGIGAVGKLFTDALNVMTNVFFPSVWFSKGQTWRIDDKTNTVPAPNYARLLSTSKLFNWNNSGSWDKRALFTDRWLFSGYMNGIFNFRTQIRLNDVLGPLMAILAIAAWNISGNWFTTNLMGWGVCYTGFQYMSPTTFSTGTLLLVGLFFYDITMVFYTPMMVKVATSLDVPIKLVFPGPGRGSMLGLGDIVLPGIMIALAMRFDLYLYYLRKQTKVIDTKNPKGPKVLVKAPYVDVTGRWGDWLWTLGAPTTDLPESFPKPYFKASLVGYVFGLIMTLIFLNIFNHAQPALLYLVPSVLIAQWTTGLFRREIKLMLSYTEAAQEENDNEKKFQPGKNQNSSPVTLKPRTIDGEKKTPMSKTLPETEKEKKNSYSSDFLFMFSLSKPKSKHSEVQKT